ncbi:MAG: ABC transporter permease subunit [Myxococcales bacterium]|nr:ABC transporter permease subunit [Myxococcales bacterium]
MKVIAERTTILYRLELAEALRSRWMILTAATYSLVFGMFVWLGLRESSVLGFTGMSRVVLNLSNAMVLTIPLVALVATSQSIVRARTSGFFELFLAQPVRRVEWLRATLIARLAVVVAPLGVLLLLTLAYGLGEGRDGALAPMVVRALAVVLSLAWAFVGVGLWISSGAKSAERATVLALVAWLTAAVLHDFGLIGALLRWKLKPEIVFGLAAVNPVEASRIAILSGIDPELSVLGPVGFWLANTLGPRWSLIIGIGWPALLGSVAIALASRRLARSDLVG